MNDPHGTLEQFGAALRAGDRDAVMSCFATDATVSVMSGEDRITLKGPGIAEAVDALLTGFADLKLTPTSRRVSKERVVEETVVSGDHVGVFAKAEPTSRRVCVNVRLSAWWGPKSTLESLLVEADTRALFAQIAGTDDTMGVTGGLIAIVRERHDGALQVTDVTDVTNLSLAPVRAPRGTAHSARSRRRWVVATAAAVALFAAALTWRSTSTTGSLEAAQAASHTASTARSPTPSPRVALLKPGQTGQPKPAAAPVIATAAPKTVPHVQAGKQMVLKSDVLFAFDSAALTPAATAALTQLAQLVREMNVTGTIQINGYTDNLGGVDYDSALSASRAVAVARVLQGALVGRLVTLAPQGFGQANPIAPNTSEAGRARNRRVTIVLPVTH
jgi:outer membrane protein OmpA-like peptidoglycan-associated protein